MDFHLARDVKLSWRTNTILLQHTASQSEPVSAPHSEEQTHAEPVENIWDSYPIKTWLEPSRLRQIVDEFLQAGHGEELVRWLKERIVNQPEYFQNYSELARIYEEHTHEIEEAYKVLLNRLLAQLSDPRAEQWMKKTAWNLLRLCQRNGRADLAQQLYATVAKSNLDTEFLKELAAFANSSAPTGSSITNAEEQVAAAPELEETAKALEQSPQEAMSSKPVFKVARRPEALHLNGRVGLFIDHENLWKSARSANERREILLPDNDPKEKARWFRGILRRLLERAQKEFQGVAYRVAVGNWKDPSQAFFLRVYVQSKFIVLQPEWVWETNRNRQTSNSSLVRLKENSVDFKLADEIRRVQRQALLAGSPLRQVIIVSGDGDYAHLASNLLEEETQVQIWSVFGTPHPAYNNIIGSENIVLIDDECLYR